MTQQSVIYVDFPMFWSALPDVCNDNLMSEVLVGVEVCREQGRACLLPIERLRLGLGWTGRLGLPLYFSFSLRSSFGMENGRGDISPDMLRLVLRSGFIS